jgi:flagellar assembly protein FliH
MVELFQFNELKRENFPPPSNKKKGKSNFKQMKEIKRNQPDFSLVYDKDGRIEGERIIKNATQLSEEIIQSAKKRGLEIEKAAYLKGMRKLERLLAMFQQKLEEISRHQKEIYTKSEEKVLNLTLSLASRIIHHEVRINKDIILESIRAALGKVLNREQIIIRINPKDMEFVTQNKPRLIDDLNNIQQVSFKVDFSISQGGCVIDTNLGSINATIENELEELDKLLKKEFEESMAKGN